MYIRPRKDGGYSECTALDHLVGKGRCVHELGTGTNDKLEVNRVDRGLYEIEVDSNKTEEDGRTHITEYLQSLPKINKEKKKRIISQLVNM